MNHIFSISQLFETFIANITYSLLFWTLKIISLKIFLLVSTLIPPFLPPSQSLLIIQLTFFLSVPWFYLSNATPTPSLFGNSLLSSFTRISQFERPPKRKNHPHLVCFVSPTCCTHVCPTSPLGYLGIHPMPNPSFLFGVSNQHKKIHLSS